MIIKSCLITAFVIGLSYGNQNATQNVTHNATQNAAQNIKQNATENMTQNATQNATENVTQNVTQNALTEEDNEAAPNFLIFSQRWPISACRAWQDRKRVLQACYLSRNPNSWKVLSVWTSMTGKMPTIGPLFCNTSWHFNPREVKSIGKNLTEDWTSVEVNIYKHFFWAFEWLRSGTCVAQVSPALGTQLEYFSRGLMWLRQYSMTGILGDAGIVPNNTKEYPLWNIHHAIKQKLGVNPIIECRQEHFDNHLYEIHICLNMTFDLVDCDDISVNFPSVSRFASHNDSVLANCDFQKPVIYPKVVMKDAMAKLELMSTLRRNINIYNLLQWFIWMTL